MWVGRGSFEAGEIALAVGTAQAEAMKRIARRRADFSPPMPAVEARKRRVSTHPRFVTLPIQNPEAASSPGVIDHL